MSDLNIVHRWSFEGWRDEERPRTMKTKCGMDALKNIGAHIAADIVHPPLPRPAKKYPHPRWCRRCVR